MKTNVLLKIFVIIAVIVLILFGIYKCLVKYEDGFLVINGTLVYYDGLEKEVTVPDNVKTIGMNAFSGDMDHGENLEKVIIPGTVKKIISYAFAFTNADYIYIEEGVKTLGNYVFMDSYIREVTFPKSVKKCGYNVLDTEEGLYDVKIIVKDKSYMHKVIVEQDPYGEYELVIE